MVRLYDPKDDADLARVEEILQKEGIEFYATRAPAGAPYPLEIQVAEEDLPLAEELLSRGPLKR